MSWFGNEPIEQPGYERIISIEGLNNWRTSQKDVGPDDQVFLKIRGLFQSLREMVALGTYGEILMRCTAAHSGIHLIDRTGVDLGNVNFIAIRNNLYIIDRWNARHVRREFIHMQQTSDTNTQTRIQTQQSPPQRQQPLSLSQQRQQARQAQEEDARQSLQDELVLARFNKGWTPEVLCRLYIHCPVDGFEDYAISDEYRELKTEITALLVSPVLEPLINSVYFVYELQRENIVFLWFVNTKIEAMGNIGGFFSRPLRAIITEFKTVGELNEIEIAAILNTLYRLLLESYNERTQHAEGKRKRKRKRTRNIKRKRNLKKTRKY